MKRLFCLLFSVVLTGMLFAQVGFIDHEGYVVIEPKYKSALPFSEGVAVVETFKGYKQFIDANGNVVIKMKFLDAKSFREGLAPVMESKEKGWGYINKQGKYVIAPNPKIQFADSFYEGLARVTDDKHATFIRRDGSIHIVLDVGARNFSEGYAAALILVDVDKKKKRKWGYIDKFGKWIIEPKYDIAFSFSEGLAMVGMEDEKGNKTIQFIEPSGSVRIEMPEKVEPNSLGVVVDYQENISIEFNEGYVIIRMTETFEKKPQTQDTPPESSSNWADIAVIISKTGEISKNPMTLFGNGIINEGVIIGGYIIIYDTLGLTEVYQDLYVPRISYSNSFREGYSSFRVMLPHENDINWKSLCKRGSNIFNNDQLSTIIIKRPSYVKKMKDGKWVYDFGKGVKNEK